ncbi:DUF982 domain-containing protein [Aminobacter anthyllidis]|uniref:DUF982 domain-containing protein n=1 Tax=Aminobacter anthyllidis TaxID=1035067 RepID=A0A9X1AIF4_9HYPH|nr:DUF982 domain-containing protein [Aminobacter anthyllidis]
MHNAFFRIPVTVLLSTGDTRTLCGASDATIFMMEKEKWPEEHGSSYRDALQACTGSLSNADDVENARRAFLAAAHEAGFNVQRDGDAPSLRSVEQPKSSYTPMRNGAIVSKTTFLPVSWHGRNGYHRGSGAKTNRNGWH